MKKARLGKHTVEFYDSIDEMPIVRYYKYQKYLLVDSGVGSDLSDFDTHIEKVMRYATSKDIDSTIKEMNNMRQNVYMIQQELSPKYLAFSSLVARLDGKTIGDTDEDIKAVYDALKSVLKKDVDKEADEVKKKVDSEMRLYFPQLFESAKEKEYYDILKRLAQARINTVTGKKGEDVEELTTKLMTYSKPQIFSGTDSVELRYEKEFERLCLLISGELNVQPKQMNVKEFYTAYEIMKERSDEHKKMNKNGR